MRYYKVISKSGATTLELPYFIARLSGADLSLAGRFMLEILDRVPFYQRMRLSKFNIVGLVHLTYRQFIIFIHF